MPWLIAAAGLLIYEFWALGTKHKTLSRMMYDANNSWPLLSTLVGLVVGGLLVHFFWHWCPGTGQGVG